MPPTEGGVQTTTQWVVGEPPAVGNSLAEQLFGFPVGPSILELPAYPGSPAWIQLPLSVNYPNLWATEANAVANIFVSSSMGVCPADIPGVQPSRSPAAQPSDEDESDDEETVHRHISLGFQKQNLLGRFTINLNRFLNPFNITVHAFGEVFDSRRRTLIESWDQVGLTDYMARLYNFNDTFPVATERAEVIHFNLEGIEPGTNVRSYLDFANLATSGDFLDPRAPTTAVELYRIRENPELCRKTLFYERGSVYPPAPSAQASIELCGPMPPSR